MAYFKPYVDESGLHIPTYNEIKENLIEQAKSIFGEDIYLENDSQDYQFIAIMADRIHDCFLTSQLIYNNRSPLTAIGAALDGVVKLNGLKRKSKTKSRCNVLIKGVPKTTIKNGTIADIDNTNWDLPDTVIIGKDGFIEVEAICQKYDCSASIGEISKIVTPTNGWESVINNESSTYGQVFETDSMLRARQSISTARPSKTVIEGLTGGIAEISEVTRHRLYENDTNIPDENGIPGHSIALVIEGGKNEEIANEIYLRKTPGCYTYGDIEINASVKDINSKDDFSVIRFFRPVYKDVYVNINIKSLAGFTAKTVEDIKVKIVEYLNSLHIGDNLTVSVLWAIALSAMPSMASPIFSIIAISAGFSANEQCNEELELAFNHVTVGKFENIVINIS